MTFRHGVLHMWALILSLLVCFLWSPLLDQGAHARPTIDDEAHVEPPTPGLIQLDQASFVGVTTELAASYDFVLLEFYSHWCPACKAFQPAYKEIATHMKKIMDEEDLAWGRKGVAAQSASRPARVAVARIDCPENTRLCDAFKIRKYPTLYVDRPMVFGSMVVESETRVEVDVKPRTKEQVLKRLGEIVDRGLEVAVLPEGYSKENQLDVMDNHGLRDDQESNVQPPSLPGSNARPSTDCDVKGDVTIATIEMFEYLKSTTVLSSLVARKALVDWLGLLESSHLVEECASGAGEALRVLSTAWPPSSEQIVDIDTFRQVRICGKEEKRPYVSCAGSTPETRGYTCGLWMLFHSLSVRMPMGMESGDEGARWMKVIEGYIEHFFQCADCAEHFLQELHREDAGRVRSKRDAVLWLWRTHNRVNERLVREDKEGTNPQDPVFRHVQWPVKDVCSTCYVEPSGAWNEEGVLQFLFAQYYGVSNDRPLGADVQQTVAAPSKAATGTWSRALLIVAIVVVGLYHSLKINNIQYGPLLGRRAHRQKGRALL